MGPNGGRRITEPTHRHPPSEDDAIEDDMSLPPVASSVSAHAACRRSAVGSMPLPARIRRQIDTKRRRTSCMTRHLSSPHPGQHPPVPIGESQETPLATKSTVVSQDQGGKTSSCAALIFVTSD